MTLTAEENERLSRVGPGTPMGQLLRRYWHPIAAVQELSEENPTRFVRILGEDLVLWKDKSGRVGLIQDHCVHRGASLLYGRVEERGIACAYHGWLYDTRGNCLETPAEPADSKFCLTVKATAYPVQTFIGLYWAYLGPDPAPVIPPYDLWVRKDLHRHLVLGPQLDCNWFQAIENGVDAWHSAILHQDANGRGPLPNTTRGTIDEIDHIDYSFTTFGIMKKHLYKEGWTRQHPLIFPNTLGFEDLTQINVPIDDTHMDRYRVYSIPVDDQHPANWDQDVLPARYEAPHKTPGDAVHPLTRFEMHGLVEAQDYMVWETQRPIADRTIERLATSDSAVVMLRNLFNENMEIVQRGDDPFALVRDPSHPMISTMSESDRPTRTVGAARVEHSVGRGVGQPA
jgi:5,5'-dehydrodivanillate O-demethylase oxygenase subunit